MQRYKLVIAYDGFAYAGWQVQPGMKTIQCELEKCFHRLTGENIKVHGSGRTDQGVHAAGQVAHADLPALAQGGQRALPGLRPDSSPRQSLWRSLGLRGRDYGGAGLHRAVHLPENKIIQAANSLLSADIRLLKVTAVKASFHARRDAVSKEYRYFIWNGAVLPPFLYRYRTHVRLPLNVSAMQKSAELLTGKHDFAAFTANPKRVVESTVRDLSLLAVRRHGNEIIIAARGDGFLYRMARSLAGFLIRVGMGDLPPAEARKILDKKERTAVVPTAPPQGLFLWKVYYD